MGSTPPAAELEATELGRLDGVITEELDLILEADERIDEADLEVVGVDVLPEQAFPVTVGTCALAEPLVPVNPNSTL